MNLKLLQVILILLLMYYRYLRDGAAFLHMHLSEMQLQFEELQNTLDLVGFETEVELIMEQL